MFIYFSIPQVERKWCLGLGGLGEAGEALTRKVKSKGVPKSSATKIDMILIVSVLLKNKNGCKISLINKMSAF